MQLLRETKHVYAERVVSVFHTGSHFGHSQKKENKRKIKWLNGSCLRAFAALICKAESKVIIEDAE